VGGGCGVCGCSSEISRRLVSLFDVDKTEHVSCFDLNTVKTVGMEQHVSFVHMNSAHFIVSLRL